MTLVLGIDKFMSECRALTNLVGNGVACVVVSRWEGELDVAKLNEVMAHPVAIGTDISDKSPQPMGTDSKVTGRRASDAGRPADGRASASISAAPRSPGSC